MSLPYEYFEKDEHITDLTKLKDDELYYIIRSFNEELGKRDYQKNENLIKLCDNTKETIKNIKFILNGYINALNEKRIIYSFETDITHLLTDIDKIESQLNIIKHDELIKKIQYEKIFLDIRRLHLSLCEFVFMEETVGGSIKKCYNVG